jgi:hypothetical protein
VDGKIAGAAPYPAPVLPVTVMIASYAGNSTYAGAPPSEVEGVMQINASIPMGVTGNAVPVSVQIGIVSTQNSVTIAGLQWNLPVKPSWGAQCAAPTYRAMRPVLNPSGLAWVGCRPLRALAEMRPHLARRP